MKRRLYLGLTLLAAFYAIFTLMAPFNSTYQSPQPGLFDMIFGIFEKIFLIGAWIFHFFFSLLLFSVFLTLYGLTKVNQKNKN